MKKRKPRDIAIDGYYWDDVNAWCEGGPGFRTAYLRAEIELRPKMARRLAKWLEQTAEWIEDDEKRA